MIGQPHILSTTDIARGIQALAAKFLGDASKWREIVNDNKLTPPYMTLDPSEVYGPPAGVVSTTSSLSADTQSIVIQNQPQSINRLYFSNASSSGLVAESVGVSSYDGNTFKLATPLQNAYNQGATVQLFSTYIVGSTNVLLPGDVIYSPVQGNATNFAINNQSQLMDVFGSDLQFPLAFSNGDFATIQGLNLAHQRFKMALLTEIGSVPLHPALGSRLNHALGTGSSTTKWNALVRDALIKLPEVSDVKNVTTNKTGTTLYINADVYTNTSQTAIEFRNEALTLIG